MSSPRVSSARLDAAFLNAAEPVFLLGADRRVLFVNKAWEALTGHGLDSVSGLVCLPAGPNRPGDLPSLAGCFAPPPEALAGRPTAGFALIVQPSGERRHCRLEFYPLHDAGGLVTHILGFVRDPDQPGEVPESEAYRGRHHLLEIRHRLERRHGFDSLIGSGPAHSRIVEQVKAAALSTASVMIVGEKGTGKRTVARAVHHNGPMSRRPLQLFDCAVLPAAVLERELFAPDTSRDDQERADGRSLLLLNINDLPRDLQATLATMIGDKCRVLATTDAGPEESLASDLLRSDLYHALTTFTIQLLPLRRRLDELPLLAQHFLDRANLRGGRVRDGFDAAALRSMLAYDWPGNLQELARVVEATHAVGSDDRIRDEYLPSEIKGNRASAYLPPPPKLESLDQLLEQVERRLIEQALARARQNKSRAAELLGISRPRLYRRIKELNIPDEAESDETLTSAG